MLQERPISLARSASFCRLLFICAYTASLASAQTRIAVIRPERSASSRTAADALVAQLKAQGRVCKLFVAPRRSGPELEELFAQVNRFDPAVIATAGAKLTALTRSALADKTVVYFMVPNALDSAFASTLPGVTSNVRPDVQIAWLKETAPAARRVAVLCSKRTQAVAAALAAAARDTGIELLPILSRSDKFPDAIKALNRGGFDGVLMIPDGAVYNGPNIKRLLEWGIRQKRAVWAFSIQHVEVAALGGVVSDPASVGREAAALIGRVLAGEASPVTGPRYSEDYVRAVNLRTARMIDAGLASKRLEDDVRRFGE